MIASSAGQLGRTDGDGNDGNRNPDDEDDGERAEGCGLAAGAHHEGACREDGRVGGLPFADCERGQAGAALGEVPGQGTVYRQGGVVSGESSFIRERVRTLGMTMQDLADRVGLLQRLLADECELCGATVDVEVHHIRALRDLNVKGEREKPKWIQIMAARKCKTLVVCRTCHMDIHAGRSNPGKQI